MNGNVKITVAALGSFLVGLVTMAMWFGAAVAKIEMHMADEVIHESEMAKRVRIAEMISAGHAPVMVEIREMRRQLDAIESKVNR